MMFVRHRNVKDGTGHQRVGAAALVEGGGTLAHDDHGRAERYLVTPSYLDSLHATMPAAKQSDFVQATSTHLAGQAVVMVHWLLVLPFGAHMIVVAPIVVLPAPSRAVPVPRLMIW
jgi:hypothetical protein